MISTVITKNIYQLGFSVWATKFAGRNRDNTQLDIVAKVVRHFKQNAID